MLNPGTPGAVIADADAAVAAVPAVAPAPASFGPGALNEASLEAWSLPAFVLRLRSVSPCSEN